MARISYVDPARITDPELAEDMEFSRRYGTPRPETQAIRFHVPTVAKAFTTFDRFFCSILCSTFPNREYMHAAQSYGAKDNSYPPQLGYNDALTSYGKVTKLTPKDSNAWFQYAQTAQQTGNYPAAVTGYKRYLKLNPASTSKAQIEQLIKQLSPAAAAPAKKTK